MHVLLHKNTSINYCICFIDDESTDNTLLEIKKLTTILC